VQLDFARAGVPAAADSGMGGSPLLYPSWISYLDPHGTMLILRHESRSTVDDGNGRLWHHCARHLSMIRPRRNGWKDPLGAALLIVSLVVLAFLWHAAAQAPGLVIEHWHAAPVAQ
jgi:hypothetical protein